MENKLTKAEITIGTALWYLLMVNLDNVILSFETSGQK